MLLVTTRFYFAYTKCMRGILPRSDADNFVFHTIDVSLVPHGELGRP